MVSVEVRSSEKARDGGYVTGLLWTFRPSYSVPKLLDDAEEALTRLARHDGAAITIREEEA